MLLNLRVIEYSDDVTVVFLFHPPNLLYHLLSPLPENSIIVVICCERVYCLVHVTGEA